MSYLLQIQIANHLRVMLLKVFLALHCCEKLAKQFLFKFFISQFSSDNWRFERHFPFWAEMEPVITASCDDFCYNFLPLNQDPEIFFTRETARLKKTFLCCIIDFGFFYDLDLVLQKILIGFWVRFGFRFTTIGFTTWSTEAQLWVFISFGKIEILLFWILNEFDSP